MTDTHAPERIWAFPEDDETSPGEWYGRDISERAMPYLRTDIHESAIAQRDATIARLVEACDALKSDMLERSRAKMDVIHGEEYRVVNAGNTAWWQFCAALAAAKQGEHQAHWHVRLEGFPSNRGDVITKDGEVIGTYTCDDNDYCEFTPNGADAYVINGTMIGPFCAEIAEWHEANKTRGE